MKSDTLKITTVTDSTLKSKNFVEKTITIEKSNYNSADYLSKSFDFLGTISWPLAIIIIVLLLKKQIIQAARQRRFQLTKIQQVRKMKFSQNF